MAVSRETAVGLLALLAAFVAGAGTALLVASPPASEKGQTVAAGTVASAADEPRGAELLESLDLTTEQRRTADSILDDLRAASDSIFRTSTARLREETRRARRGILSVLTSEQAEAFGERLRELRTVRVRRLQVGDSVVREDTLP